MRTREHWIDAIGAADEPPDSRMQATSYSVGSAIVGSMLSARRVGTTQPSMQTPSIDDSVANDHGHSLSPLSQAEGAPLKMGFDPTRDAVQQGIRCRSVDSTPLGEPQAKAAPLKWDSTPLATAPKAGRGVAEDHPSRHRTRR